MESIKIDIERRAGAAHINITDRASGRLLATLADGADCFTFSDEAMTAAEENVLSLFGVPAGSVISEPATTRASFEVAGITVLDVRMTDAATLRDCDA